MKFLSIDTSTQYSVVVLSDENGMIFGQRRFFEKGRCEHLFSLIDHCLKKTKTKLEKIDFFGLGIGPGSFTGLRIGIAAMKALSYALKKNCFVFSSLDAIAFYEAVVRSDHLCVCVDAKRSNVYCRFYSMGRHGSLCRRTEDLLLSNHAFLKRVSPGSVLMGDALKVLTQEFPDRLKCVRLLDEKFWYPQPESLSRLTLEAFKKGDSVGPFVLNARYLYDSDCQVNPIARISRGSSKTPKLKERKK